MTEFLSAAIGLIHRKAREVRTASGRAADQYGFVHLAAHLFAIGQQLQASPGDAYVGSPHAELILSPPQDLEDLLQQLEGLRTDLDAAALYQVVDGALDFMAKALKEEEIPPSTTQIEEVVAEGRRFLGGVVQHWMRPLSLLAQERRSRYQSAGPGRPPSPAPHLDNPAAHRLAFFWESDRQPPTLQRVLPPRRRFPLFEESGAEALRQERFRVALCPLRGPFYPHFQVNPDNLAFFRANPEDSMEKREALHEHLEAICAVAQKENEEVHLLVFPELTVDSEALAHLSSILRKSRKRYPFGVVAGSFHSWGGGKKADDWTLPLPHNELVLLDHRGDRLAGHQKRGRFRIFSKFFEKPSRLFPGFPAEDLDRESLPLEIFEEIEYGSELQILDTTLGRIAFLICADAIAPDDRGYLPMIRRLRPDLLIVVAMSHETEPFDVFAADMSRHWIATLVVNAFCICEATAQPPAPPPNLALCDLALFEPRGAAPTRVRWRYGCCEAQCRYFKPRNGFKDWQETAGIATPTGISWLGGREERLGLVIDLGAHIQSVPKQ